MIIPMPTKACSLNNRMKYLIGHLKANLAMIEEGRYCIDIIRQNQAVISALKKINELLLKNHLDTCVTTAIRNKSERARKKVLDEIIQVFKENENER
jgi:DNA-binding FrmR family transcriptional regulator